MKINIFGVGRAGTKAIQLYIAYCLARANGRVKVIYEPYVFHSRRGPLNYEGLYYNFNEPQFMEGAGELSRGHRQFLAKLNEASGAPAGVAKFIYGNGRIAAINAVTQPDLTIVIVRDLYESLASLASTFWDYLSFGYFLLGRSYITKYPALLREIEQKNIVPAFDSLRPQINDTFAQNALFWYAMNLSALRYDSPNAIFLNYADMEHLPELLNHRLRTDIFQEGELLKNRVLTGRNLHGDWPLHTVGQVGTHAFGQAINQLAYFARQNRSKPPFGFPIGTVEAPREGDKPDTAGRPADGPKTRIRIEPNALLDLFNEKVMQHPKLIRP